MNLPPCPTCGRSADDILAGSINLALPLPIVALIVEKVTSYKEEWDRSEVARSMLADAQRYFAIAECDVASAMNDAWSNDIDGSGVDPRIGFRCDHPPTSPTDPAEADLTVQRAQLQSNRCKEAVMRAEIEEVDAEAAVQKAHQDLLDTIRSLDPDNYDRGT